MARAHRASDEITMLAASSKLNKTARKWYDTQSGAVLESWMNLSQSLKRMFDRRIPFLATMQKVEARKWMPAKELFQEYAIDKMSMLYGLELSYQDTINLLIGGITNEALRAMAATIQADSVENFIDHMCQLAATVCCEEKEAAQTGPRQQTHKQNDRRKDQICKNCGKRGHHHKECRSTQVTCFYCKDKSYRSYECPKAKKKEQSAIAGGSTATVVQQQRKVRRQSRILSKFALLHRP